MNKIKKRYKSEFLVLKNFIYLSVMKVSNLVLPLVTLPYLIRIIGFDNVGKINLAASIMMYLNILVAYGYAFTGTRFFSGNFNKKDNLSEYYSYAMAVRFWLLLIGFIFMVGIILLVENFHDIYLICFMSFGVVISQYLIPIWVFQGLQTMKYLTYIDLCSKILFTVLIFMFVKVESDYLLVPIFTSVGACISGIISIYIIRNKFKLKINLKYFFDVKKLAIGLADGKDVFIQQLYVSIYGPITIILLGALSDSLSVGYYTVAEKILNIPLMAIIVAVQAYYPYAVNLYKDNVEAYYRQINFIIVAIFSGMNLLMVLMFLYRTEIYYLITGTNDSKGIYVFSVMLLGISLSALGQLLTQIFVTIDKMKYLKKISLSVMLLTLLITPFIINYSGALGLAYYTVCRQLIVISSCLIVIFWRRKFFSNV